jgi:hypothetical protein
MKNRHEGDKGFTKYTNDKSIFAFFVQPLCPLWSVPRLPRQNRKRSRGVGVETQNGRFKMVSRMLATLLMLLLAFVAFSDNALNTGYFTIITGFLFLFLAVAIWFKWGTIGHIFYAAAGDDPIIETASKVVGRMAFRQHDPSSHDAPSSSR